MLTLTLFLLMPTWTLEFQLSIQHTQHTGTTTILVIPCLFSTNIYTQCDRLSPTLSINVTYFKSGSEQNRLKNAFQLTAFTLISMLHIALIITYKLFFFKNVHLKMCILEKEIIPIDVTCEIR